MNAVFRCKYTNISLRAFRRRGILGCLLFVVLGLSAFACSAATSGVSGNAHIGAAAQITSVVVSRVGGQTCREAPVTFGQPFRRGDLPRGNTVVGYLRGKRLPTQVNVKARNPKGSIRHAVITMMVPCRDLYGGAHISLASRPLSNVPERRRLTMAELLRSRFNATLTLNVNGKAWSLAARPLLKKVVKEGGCGKAGRLCRRWLSGPLVSEWVVGGPVRDATGQALSHLAAYFAVRAYGPAPVRRVRVDVIVENDWTYQAAPHDYTYDAAIYVAGKRVYGIKNLTQYRQSRWHKIFWWGRPDPLYAALSSRYLQESRAVPRYEHVRITSRFLSSVLQECAPMRPCNQTPHMEITGSQEAIGPLPLWSSVYVNDTDYRAFRWMLANTDALGAYGIHYRVRRTGDPISLAEHPCFSTIRGAFLNGCPVLPRDVHDAPPHCKRNCRTPLHADEAHHPAPAYVAYLVTGDWYYMEELEFWADWVEFWQNPPYRHYWTGLIHGTQIRGQAWALRTLGDAAYILPDRSPLKSFFNAAVENNIRWYNRHYTDNPNANKLHVLANFDAIIYPNSGQPRTGIAVWQQSYFNWALGNLVDLGFHGARKLRKWFARFQINLMTSRHFCWPLAPAYELRVRNTEFNPLYSSLAAVYRNTYPKLRGISCKPGLINAAIKRMFGRRRFDFPPGTMIGYPYSPTGYPAYFQVGLASSVSSGLPKSRRAWEVFMHRTTLPNYSNSPKYAVIPRHIGNVRHDPDN